MSLSHIPSIDALVGKHAGSRKVQLDIYSAALRGATLTAEDLDAIRSDYEQMQYEDVVDTALSIMRQTLRLCGISALLREHIFRRTYSFKNVMLKLAEFSLNHDARAKIEKIPSGVEHTAAMALDFCHAFNTYFRDANAIVLARIVELLNEIYAQDPKILDPFLQKLKTKSRLEQNNSKSKESAAKIYGQRIGEVFTSYDVVAANWTALQILHRPHVLPDWAELLEASLPTCDWFPFFRDWLKSSKFFRGVVIGRAYKALSDRPLLKLTTRVYGDLLLEFLDEHGLTLSAAEMVVSDEVIFPGDVSAQPRKHLKKTVFRCLEPTKYGKRFETLSDNVIHYRDIDPDALGRDVLAALKNETKGINYTTNARDAASPQPTPPVTEAVASPTAGAQRSQEISGTLESKELDTNEEETGDQA